MRDTFLSIDLDYFSNRDICNKVTLPIINYCNQNNIKFEYVLKHKDCLNLVNNSNNIKTLINLDYHSDFGKRDWVSSEKSIMVNKTTNGTWISFVYEKIKQESKYIWIYPSDLCLTYGISHDPLKGYNPFKIKKPYGWKSAIKSKNLDIIKYEQIKNVCFSISMDYWRSNKTNNLSLNLFNQMHTNPLSMIQLYCDTYQDILHIITNKSNYADAFIYCYNNYDSMTQLSIISKCFDSNSNLLF